MQQEVEEEVAPRLEPEMVEQEIRHAVNERLKLVRRLDVEEGGLGLRHMEVVREIAEIVGVPEAVVEGDLEIEEAEREKQREQEDIQQKRLQRTPPVDESERIG